MDEITAVDGAPLAPESVRMLDYLKTRAAEMSAPEIRARIQSAAEELEKTVVAVSPSEARLRPIAGKWNIAEVVDHIAQTQARGAEELRHLLVGRRPPLPPVYEGLLSGASQWAPLELLIEDLRGANRAMLEVLESLSDELLTGVPPTVRTLIVALRKFEDGRTEAQLFFAELGWKEYALLQRLHLLDHRRQVKELQAAAVASGMKGTCA